MAGELRGEPGTALRVEGLCKSFGDLEVLRGVSLAARERDVIAILGASGSGARAPCSAASTCWRFPTPGRSMSAAS